MTLLQEQSPAPLNRMVTWVTKTTTTPVLGTLSAGSYLLRAHCHVTEAFNSSGSDIITVGYSDDADAFVTSIDVSTTGIKTVTLGALGGYNSASHPVVAYYTAGGTAPTTGKAIIILEIFKTPLQP